MSLKSWKQEFFLKVNAKRARDLRLLLAAERKWIGLQRKNLKKHNVILDSDIIMDKETGKMFNIGGSNCHLCNRYIGKCLCCPLYSCYTAFYNFCCTGNTKKMLELIRRVIKKFYTLVP